MLSARAYSFRQKSKLAISLSWIGGYANVVMLLTCGTFASHMTGNATRFGELLLMRDWPLAAAFGLLIVSFWFGALSSAFMTEWAQRAGVRSKYVLPMVVEGALLTVLAWLVYQHTHGGASNTLLIHSMANCAAFAMGLQNATITEISGAVIRTTHLTGVITDFGLEGVRFLNWYLDRARGRWWSRSGRVLRISQRHPTAQRLFLLFAVFWSFIVGAAMGTAAYRYAPALSLLLPVAFIAWIIVMDWRKPIAGVKELDLLSDPELRAYGIVKALLPPELGLYRLTHHGSDRAHQPPDFYQWMEHLPPHWRVIILAVSPLTYFNENSALALRDVTERLHAKGRDLIVSGITRTQYKTLVHNGLLDALESENLCPDLEFAIARGIDLLRHKELEPQINTDAHRSVMQK
ncbi:MAG: hypothetical protein QOE14_2302 [Humisphaera sp.]|nr:hypothetical protein [Humisphaera sp.]